MGGPERGNGPRPGRNSGGKGASGATGKRKLGVSPAIRAKAEELAKNAGIPRTLAFQVAMGNLTLNEVIQRMAQADRAESLMKKHGFEKSLAVQIAKGHADLDAALFKRRLDAHLGEHRRRSALHEAEHSQTPVVLGLHGRRTVAGYVTKVDKYEFEFFEGKAPPTGDQSCETIHKLQVKYAYARAVDAKARKRIGRDPERDADAEPIRRPQDRFAPSDRTLFGLVEGPTVVRLVTLEGDAIKGYIRWIGRWEIGVSVGSKKPEAGVEVIVFRHALADMETV